MRKEARMAAKATNAEKRTASLVVRLTPKEMKMAQDIAGKRGKTVSEWIREKLYEAPQAEMAEMFYRARMQELMDLWQQNRLTDVTNDKGRMRPDEFLPSRGAREKIAVDFLRKEINKEYLGDHKPRGKKKEPVGRKTKATNPSRKTHGRKKA